MCIHMSLDFLCFCSRICMFVSLHIHICLGVWVCLVFPHAWICWDVLVHLHLSLSVCICLYSTWPVYEQVDFPVPLCISPLGFCKRMLLHVSACTWRSVTPVRLQISLKCLASQGWNLMLENGWAVPLLRSLLAQKLFSSKTRSTVSPKDPFCLPPPHLDLQGPLSAHF